MGSFAETAAVEAVADGRRAGRPSLQSSSVPSKAAGGRRGAGQGEGQGGWRTATAGSAGLQYGLTVGLVSDTVPGIGMAGTSVRGTHWDLALNHPATAYPSEDGYNKSLWL